MTKLVIFDLDGTLLDTVGDLAAACNHALEMCGCPPHTPEVYKLLIGGGIRKLFWGALPEDKRADEMIEKMRSHFLPYYKSHIADLTRPYEGIEEMLDSLTEAGVEIAIASNKFQSGTETLAQQLLGKYSFLEVLGQREGWPTKPDPQIIRDVMDRIPDLKPEEVIYCGDSDVDMFTGHNAGVRTIGVCWGFRGRAELESCNPWLVVETPSEITEAVLSR
jgi:phosphoglycolate phosphatase